MAANLTNWAFSTLQTDYRCRLIPFICNPPLSACARDLKTARTFCCEYDHVCWNDVATCASDGSTFTCQRGGTSWCCVFGREQCDQTRENSCLSTLQNLFNNVPEVIRNETYSSLSSAEPSASFLSFNPIALIATAQTSSPTSASFSTDPISIDTISGASSLTTTSENTLGVSSRTTTSSASETTTQVVSEGSNDTALSGGAIGGIVVGAIIGVALSALGSYYIIKRSRNPKGSTSCVDGKLRNTRSPENRAYQDFPELPAGSTASELRGNSVVPELSASEMR